MLTDKLLLILIVAFLLNKVVLNRPPMQLDVPEPAAHRERFSPSLHNACPHLPKPIPCPERPALVFQSLQQFPPRIGHRQILP